MEAAERVALWIGAIPGTPPVRIAQGRHALSELSSNMDRTPRRRSKTVMQSNDKPPQDSDSLTTPRAPNLPLPPPTAFSPPHPSPSVSSASSALSSSVLSDTASNQRRGVKRRRSESPKKRLANLSLARYPVVPCSIETLRDLPCGAHGLAKSLRRCQLRVGILHPESSDAMQPYLEDDDGDDGSTDRLFSKQRQRVGEAPRIEDIIDVVRQARENEQDQASEAAWNGDVHMPLLRTALRSSKWRAALRVENMYGHG